MNASLEFFQVGRWVRNGVTEPEHVKAFQINSSCVFNDDVDGIAIFRNRPLWRPPPFNVRTPLPADDRMFGAASSSHTQVDGIGFGH